MLRPLPSGSVHRKLLNPPAFSCWLFSVWRVVRTRPAAPSALSYEDVRGGNDPVALLVDRAPGTLGGKAALRATLDLKEFNEPLPLGADFCLCWAFRQQKHGAPTEV